MVTLLRSAAPLEEALGTGGMTITSATRASSLCVSTSSKTYNNPLANLATGVTQGLKAKLNPRPAFRMLPRSILDKRSMMAAMCGASLRHGERNIPTGTMMMTITATSHLHLQYY
jgi:hypothetical protein